MKKIYTIVAAILLMATVWAQSSQKMSYQAIIRNASNVLVTSHAVGMKISILGGSASGTLVYTETQTPTTNANGLVTIEIGGGTGFDTISWGIGAYFIKTEIDPAGGTAYSITGTSQLLSVPYALYASNCGSVYSKDGKYGFGTTSPVAKFDFLGGNNWDVVNGEGDFRIGNSKYRIRMGVALGGGGAGASTIMQYGQTGGYNVLALGAQGNKLLYLNGNTSSLGIGTDNPVGKFEIKSGTSTPQLVLNQMDDNYGRIRIQNTFTASNTRFWDIAGYISNATAADDILNFFNLSTGNLLGIGGNGAIYFSGNAGTAGQVLQSNGNGSAPTWVNSNKHYIGESYGGGIVFYVYDNGYHGLIAATADQSTGIRWYGGTNINTRARADGIGAGKANTAIAIASQGAVDGSAFAATVCNEYSVTVGSETYGDWYLPSKYELNLLLLQKAVVGGFGNYVYWSSTEIDANGSWMLDFGANGYIYFSKNNTYHVRAIRSF